MADVTVLLLKRELRNREKVRKLELENQRLRHQLAESQAWVETLANTIIRDVPMSEFADRPWLK